MRFIFFWACAAALPHLAHCVCECGYITNTQEVYQYALTTDFNTTTTAQFQNSSDWIVSTNVLAASSSRPIATNYTSENVNIVNQTLELTCSAYDSSVSDSIRSAQIHTSRTDIQYGSFRATFQVVGTSQGAISALFFYANDTTEVDIELLTRDNPNSVRFTNQPDSTSQVIMPDGLTRNTTNDYRFDWSSESTTFYINNVLSDTKTEDVPRTNGSIFLNSWGGSSFAGDVPPKSDVTMAVSGIQLYFNTSDSELSSSWTQSCQQAKVEACSIDSENLQKNTSSTSTTSLASSVKSQSSSGRTLETGLVPSLTTSVLLSSAVWLLG